MSSKTSSRARSSKTLLASRSPTPTNLILPSHLDDDLVGYNVKLWSYQSALHQLPGKISLKAPSWKYQALEAAIATLNNSNSIYTDPSSVCVACCGRGPLFQSSAIVIVIRKLTFNSFYILVGLAHVILPSGNWLLAYEMITKI